MRKIRVYVDTSVFGGTQDVEFAEPSNQFFKRVRKGEFLILLSPVTLQELSHAPESVQTIWLGLTMEQVRRSVIK